MRVLVTGATGFVGRHFLRYAASRHPNWTIFASAHENPKGTPEAADFQRADLLVPEEALALLKVARPDAIVHLAGLTRGSPEELWQANVNGTRNLLGGAGMAPREEPLRFVLASSAAVYGSTAADHLPVRETMGIQPTSPYALSKAAQELACQAGSHGPRFELVRARLFNLVGPGQPDHLVPAAFIKQLRNAKGNRIGVGDLTTTRDFVDVRDAVHALAILLQSGQDGSAYNVAGGHERTIGEVLDLLIQVAGWKTSVEVEVARIAGGEVLRSWACIDALSHLGWAPQVSLEQSLTDMLG